MRLISYRTSSNEQWRAGVEQNGQVVPAISETGGQTTTVRALLEAGPSTIEMVLSNARQALTESSKDVVALNAVEVGPPVPDPDKIVCLGLNYADHAAESNMAIPKAPVLFAKFRNSLVGPNAAIVLPGNSNEVDYEAELAIVIGKTCKNVTEQDALNYVAGYTIMDDVSARDLQTRTSQWTAGKALDTFAPMGPGIVPASEIPDPQNLKVIARVNGQVLQNGNTADMIFKIAPTIAFISSIMTLVPGDIISTGTPAGVGSTRKPPIFLKEGDVVEIEIEHVGLIRNHVVGAGTKQ